MSHMGWLFGRKKAVPRVPFPEGKMIDEKALRFPAPSSYERIIEPDKVKEAVGFSKPLAFPEEMDVSEEKNIPLPPSFPPPRAIKPAAFPSPVRSYAPPGFVCKSRCVPADAERIGRFKAKTC